MLLESSLLDNKYPVGGDVVYKIITLIGLSAIEHYIRKLGHVLTIFLLISSRIENKRRHLPDPKALATSHVRLHDILALVKS